jgi:hypothetical protein
MSDYCCNVLGIAVDEHKLNQQPEEEIQEETNNVES